MKDTASGPGQLASLHYGDGEYVVLKPGHHVLCAVTGRPIALNALRYWSKDRQEAYLGPQEALSRMGPSSP
ncbi:MAG: DUF2093 domain-containing protein [Brevundimonas sp.]|jgi:hypothetical protein|uniref:DUF2093 domain-containing protein n=1 Tax=Brevundimonas sp. TaxID=1871086 RepID=UPI00391A4015